MGNIIFDGRNLKVYAGLCDLGQYAGFGEERTEKLWQVLSEDEDLFEEFVYYLENHAIRDKIRVQGYSLTDLFVWQIEKYNLITDSGKNTADCNKEKMVLAAFETMAGLKKEPETVLHQMEEQRMHDHLG